ncbi:hypothetical protein F0562_029280 [Nyssa sinensis]|uniref:AAA+ ATPase domain-containing protein n=1 Tax=Nyssa sinensis TaxID=561372 RepID=A0A5J5B4K5_9ASTE|nr:hypothetical protein F0562_029280 [Nyssa sinensis]
MQTLRTKGERLKCRVEDIISELKDAEFRSRKKRKREVENWLENVEKKINELQNLEQDVEQSDTLSGLLYGHGKRVENMIKEMDELVEQGKFLGGLFLDVHESKGEPFLTTKLIGEAFQNNLQKILEFLKKDDFLSIGIYGMGGVGKTTLATHIHNLLLEESNNIFHNVYWVTVSHDFSIHKLQDMIAKTVLKRDLTNKHDKRQRAAELSRALVQRGKCILILDDVWNHFCLEEVGICLKVNGCKLILTTRSIDVCRRMACYETIMMESLPEKETWDLFKDTLGHRLALSLDIEKVALSIAKRCAGLPLGIITMAGSMRGVKDIHEWRNVLEELENPTTGQRDMQDEVFPLLKLSYDRLKDAKLQHCFLYCALYPEDENINRQELITFFIVEGIIDRKKSMQAKLDMGHTLLNKLENACLLESCRDRFGERYVKMHDLMREMALKITKVSPRFMVAAGHEKQDGLEWMEDLEKVSLMRWIIKIPEGMSPRCPKLSTLLWSHNHNLMEIPHTFFVHMRALRVLDLSSTGICELPNSILNLENLTGLFLENCYQLEYVPPLGNLRALQVLNLSQTSIKEVPQGMEMLVNLNCLYMKSMRNVIVLPTGILPRLSSLQVLRLDIAKIVGLSRCEIMAEYVWCYSDKGQGWYRPDKVQAWPSVFIKKDKRVEISKFRLMGHLLPHDIQSLCLSRCHNVHILYNGSLLFKDLKVCEISDCDGIKYIVWLFSSNEIEVEEDSGEKSPCAPLQSLEILKLNSLSNLSALIKWGRQGDERVMTPLPAGTFFNLKDLEIENCHKIKQLFQPGLLQHLENLEKICARSCYRMEEITAEDDEGMGACSSNNSNATIFSLPKLKTFELIDIPLLKSICKGVMACYSIERITLFNCRQLKRVQFSLPLINGQPSPPHALQLILIDKDGQGWWESLEWDHPNDKNVLQPFVNYSNNSNERWL